MKNALIVIRVCIFYFRLRLIITQVFAKEVVDKVVELDKEKCKTEIAFHDFVPSSIVKRIKSKRGKEVGCISSFVKYYFFRTTARPSTV